jgi:hypothetical protein
MPSPPISAKAALAIVGTVVAPILLWGYFVAQQILLSAYLAILGALVAGFLYAAWQYFGGAGGNSGTDLQL